MTKSKALTMILVLSIALAAVLAACGPAAAPAAPTEAAAPTQAPEPTPVPVEPTAEPTQAPEPTPVPAEPTAEPAAEQPAEKVGTMAVSFTINQLDPSLVASIEHAIMFNVYETLTLWDPELGVQPRLATSWEKSEDGTEWTFHLREGVTFHDGTPFTADAVKFSYERTVEMKANAYVFAAVKEMQVVDDYTIRIVTSYPTPMDKIVGAGYGAFIMSPTMADKAPEWFAAGNGIGTGPFKYESFEPGQRLILTRNEDYWGGWTDGQFTTVVWTIAEDPAVRESMIRAGEADITWNIPFDNHESLNATGEVNAFGAPAFFDLYLHFRGDRPPFDDERVRQAFSYAFPYDEVQGGTFGGNAKVAKGAVPRLMWAPPVETTTYSFDLDKAQALLTEAGVAEPLTVRLGLSTGNADTLQVAELWRAQLAQIGVELEIQPMALGAWWDEVYSADPSIDIILQNMWPGMDSPSEFLCAVFDSNLTFFPFAAFNSPEYNEICEGALQLEATDPAQADLEYQKAERMLVDQAIAVFALDLPWNWAVRTDIQGLEPNPLYLDVVFWYDLSR